MISISDFPKSIYGKKALEQRKHLRSIGELNPWIKGPRALEQLRQQMLDNAARRLDGKLSKTTQKFQAQADFTNILVVATKG